MRDTVNVLGTEYKIIEIHEKEDPEHDDCDGYCDKSTKEIVVHTFDADNNTIKDIERYRKKVLRHEIVHAFLFESGLAECANHSDVWSMNEEMVDWFAYQGEKIYKAWKEAGAV